MRNCLLKMNGLYFARSKPQQIWHFLTKKKLHLGFGFVFVFLPWAKTPATTVHWQRQQCHIDMKEARCIKRDNQNPIKTSTNLALFEKITITLGLWFCFFAMSQDTVWNRAESAAIRVFWQLHCLIYLMVLKYYLGVFRLWNIFLFKL